jgi:hypothetical protein
MAQSLSVTFFIEVKKVLSLQLHIVLLVMLFIATTAAAQILQDPTRPSDKSLLSSKSDALELASGPVLQAVLIAKNRKIAMINGQAVKLNGSFEGQTLIRLSETEAVLRKGAVLQTLKLFPQFEKNSNQDVVKMKTNKNRQ